MDRSSSTHKVPIWVAGAGVAIVIYVLVQFYLALEPSGLTPSGLAQVKHQIFILRFAFLLPGLPVTRALSPILALVPHAPRLMDYSNYVFAAWPFLLAGALFGPSLKRKRGLMLWFLLVIGEAVLYYACYLAGVLLSD